jgi:hypothetical protein
LAFQIRRFPKAVRSNKGEAMPHCYGQNRNTISGASKMQTQPVVATPAAQLVIPTLNDAAVMPTFNAFKEAERISFIRQYDPRVQAIAGYRHAVIRYRNTDSKAVQKTAQMVTIPQLILPEEFSLLPAKAITVLMGVFEDEQDAIIKGKIELGMSHISWNDLVLDKVLDSLTAIRLSQRLTKEGIENWFNIACKEVCATRAHQLAVANKFDAEQTIKQVAGTHTAYRNLAMRLAAPVPNLGTNEAIALKNLLLVGNLSDDMAKVLLAKLEQILNPKIVENVNL